MKPLLATRWSAVVCAVAIGAAAAWLLTSCAEEEPRRAPADGEIVGFEMAGDGEAEVEVSIFNPHDEAAEIECDVEAGRAGVSMLLTLEGEGRKVVTSKLHGLKPDTRREDVTIECRRRIEE